MGREMSEEPEVCYSQRTFYHGIESLEERGCSMALTWSNPHTRWGTRSHS
jgi:hypothetical protein